MLNAYVVRVLMRPGQKVYKFFQCMACRTCCLTAHSYSRGRINWGELACLSWICHRVRAMFNWRFVNHYFFLVGGSVYTKCVGLGRCTEGGRDLESWVFRHWLWLRILHTLFVRVVDGIIIPLERHVHWLHAMMMKITKQRPMHPCNIITSCHNRHMMCSTSKYQNQCLAQMNLANLFVAMNLMAAQKRRGQYFPIWPMQSLQTCYFFNTI